MVVLGCLVKAVTALAALFLEPRLMAAAAAAAVVWAAPLRQQDCKWALEDFTAAVVEVRLALLAPGLAAAVRSA